MPEFLTQGSIWEQLWLSDDGQLVHYPLSDSKTLEQGTWMR